MSEHREKAAETVEAARIAFESNRSKPTELAIADAIAAAEPHLQRMYFERLASRADGLPPAIEEWVAKFPKPAQPEIRTLLLASFNVQAEDVAKLTRERFREAVLSEGAVYSLEHRLVQGSPDGRLAGSGCRRALEALLTKAQEIMEEGGEKGPCKRCGGLGRIQKFTGAARCPDCIEEADDAR